MLSDEALNLESWPHRVDPRYRVHCRWNPWTSFRDIPWCCFHKKSAVVMPYMDFGLAVRISQEYGMYGFLSLNPDPASNNCKPGETA